MAPGQDGRAIERLAVREGVFRFSKSGVLVLLSWNGGWDSIDIFGQVVPRRDAETAEFSRLGFGDFSIAGGTLRPEKNSPAEDALATRHLSGYLQHEKSLFTARGQSHLPLRQTGLDLQQSS